MSGGRQKIHPITGAKYQTRENGKTGGRKTAERIPQNHSIPIVYSPEQQRLSPTLIKTQLGVLFDGAYS
jgi:hypothetical protein